MGDSMTDRHPGLIGRPGRWLIFAGLPVALAVVLFVCFEQNLERTVGATALPYFLYFSPAAIVIAGMLVYGRFPKRLVIQSGIMGWIIAILLLCWYFWFGPGALKM